MGGMVKGKSDPYVKIRVTGITFRSHTIKENLNPIWNELYEVLYQTFFSYSADQMIKVNFDLTHFSIIQVILTQLPGQEIQFELFDKDIDQDDFLGRCVSAL